MKIAILGAGLMGAQIGVEYAVGGHAVEFVVRDLAGSEKRVKQSLALVQSAGLASAEVVADAATRVSYVTDAAAIASDTNLVVENVAEDLEVKGTMLRRAGDAAPAAVLASNTSSLPIIEIGRACGYPERTIGTHYWNPPLLMPLVEVILTDETTAGIEQPVMETLRQMGKRPVLVQRDVPGFVWNRLQFALLREAVWVVEEGVATPEVVDEIVRDGLARRWRYTGPFQTAALGGAHNFQRISSNLWPVLSTAESVDELVSMLPGTPDELLPLRERRDAGLRDDLLSDRGAP